MALGAILGAIAPSLIGGLLGGSGSGGGTSKQSTAPWGPQQSYLKDMFGMAQNQARAEGQPNQYQTGAINSLQGMQGGTNPYSGMNNPYLNQSIENSQNDAMRGMMPMFNQMNAQSGSFGNSGVGENNYRTAAGTLGNIATNARMNAYNQDANTWGQDQNRNMAGATDLWNMGTNMQDMPWKNIQNYRNAIGGNYGGDQTTPYSSNRALGALGGAMAGQSLFGNILGGMGGGGGDGGALANNPNPNNFAFNPNYRDASA